MKYFVLIFNYRGPDKGWDFIPEDLWIKIFQNHFLECANGIGFGGFTEKNRALINELEPFKHALPEYLKEGVYTANNQEEKKIAIFKLTGEIFKAVTQFPYLQWGLANPTLNVTEFVFFSNDVEIGGLDTSESKLFFLLTEEEKERLKKIDSRIGENLYEASPELI